MYRPWHNLSGLSREDFKRLQNEKLHTFINQYLFPFSPRYQLLFNEKRVDPRSIRTSEDLARLPFTSKMDFVDARTSEICFKEFILEPTQVKIKKAWGPSKLIPLAVNKILRGPDYVQYKLAEEFRPVFMTFTTGTTNKPVPFLYSNYDIQNLHISGARMLALFDIDRSEKIVNIFPYAPHLAFWQVVFGGLASSALIFSTGGGKTMGTEGNIAILEKIQPSVILGVPSYIYHLLRTARERNKQLPFIKKVVLGAAKVTVPFKKRLSEILESLGSKDVAIFGTYGFTEAKSAWAECPSSLDTSSGYHLYPDKEIVEIIDPTTGEVKKEGEDGEIVYTAIDARGSVMLRYRTGDFAKGGITWGTCPYCRRTGPRLSSDISRLSDVKDLQLSKVKGALVNFSHFAITLADIPSVEEWQIELKKKNNDPFDVDEMVVYVCSKNGSDPSKVEEEVRSKLLLATEVAPNEVRFMEMPEMVKRLGLETENKDKRILDNRPK